jgi:hypothetical protein
MAPRKGRAACPRCVLLPSMISSRSVSLHSYGSAMVVTARMREGRDRVNRYRARKAEPPREKPATPDAAHAEARVFPQRVGRDRFTTPDTLSFNLLYSSLILLYRFFLCKGRGIWAPLFPQRASLFPQRAHGPDLPRAPQPQEVGASPFRLRRHDTAAECTLSQH